MIVHKKHNLKIESTYCSVWHKKVINESCLFRPINKKIVYTVKAFLCNYGKCYHLHILIKNLKGQIQLRLINEFNM
jgi:hypothetical protein